jgi:toxin CcdB
MSRFSVYLNAEGAGYLLDVQANLLSHLNTRMVVPLLPKADAPAPAQTLNPTFDIDGAPCVMVTQFMAAVPQTMLQTRILSVEDRAHEVVSALDCLFQGI